MKRLMQTISIVLMCSVVMIFPAEKAGSILGSVFSRPHIVYDQKFAGVKETRAHIYAPIKEMKESSLTVVDGYQESGSDIKLQTLVDGLVFPVGIVSPGDGSGRLFILQQTGEVFIYDGSQLLPEPFLDISSEVSCCGERGLLGLAFHPNYSSNGYFYIYYTFDTGDADHPESRIVRYSVSADPDQADSSTATTLLSFTQPYANHNGGQLLFGPDGYLYLATGDGGSSGDPGNRAQTLDNYFGKILRVDVDGGFPYVIPSDNPYVEDPDDPDTLGEIWANGLRNPWRFSFDRMTGDMYIGDVGQSSWEEIDFEANSSAGGLNYGWRCYEGDHEYNTTGCDSIDAYTFPILEYDHTLGSAVTGGYVYRGNNLPFLQGKYLFGDYGSGRIWMGEDQGDGTWKDGLLLDSPYQISSFGEDHVGELYLAHYHPTNGKIFKVVANHVLADFDGDKTTDVSVYRPSNGKWYRYGQSPEWWGLSEDIPVPGDYDGDGSADLAVFRPSTGKWYVKGVTSVWWGLSDDVPVQGDYDNDGRTDFAVYRPSNGNWYVYGASPVWWGLSGDIPVPGDYDGDGSTDIAVFRPSNGKWYIKGNSPVWWGLSGDIPVPGDYDGDGDTDVAVYRPSNGKWYVKDGVTVWWGLSGDIPVPGDYDGDGNTDIAVLRPSNGTWYIKDQMTVWYYLSGDYPLPVQDTNADGDPYH